MQRASHPLRNLMLAAALPLLSAHASASSPLQQANALLDAAQAFYDGVREELLLEATVGRSETAYAYPPRSGMFDNAESLRGHAQRLQRQVKDGAPREAYLPTLDQIMGRVRALRSELSATRAPRAAEESLWRVEGMVIALRGDQEASTKNRKKAEKPSRKPARAASSGLSVTTGSNVAVGFGDRNVTAANSIAYGHIHRTYGVPRESIRTESITPKNGRYEVVALGGGKRFTVDVDPASKTVLNEKVRAY